MRPTSSDRHRRISGRFAAVLAAPGLALALLLAPGPAAADATLDALRAEGAVAERFDGFLEVRGSGSAEARALVERVNAEREEIYLKRAEELGVPVSEVGKVFAEKIVERAPEGTWFKRSDGSYVRK
jgi:hypothetical protein